jgi:Mg2+ and Co2+ transporter CorA
MSEDIVQILRAYNPIHGRLDWADVMRDAADEIEQLREDVAHYRDLYRGMIGMAAGHE